MATNSDGEPLPKPLTVIKLMRELAIVLDKHGDLPVVTPNMETTTWAEVEDVAVKDGKARILFDLYPPDLKEPEHPEARIMEDDAWGTIWLHGKWRYLTSKMDTPQRELVAEAVGRWMQSIDEVEGEPLRDYQQNQDLYWWRY